MVLLASVQLHVELKDLGACLGLTVAAKAAKSPPGLPKSSDNFDDLMLRKR